MKFKYIGTAIFTVAFIGIFVGYSIMVGRDYFSKRKTKTKSYSTQIDSLQRLYDKAKTREQWYLLQLKQDSAGLYQLEQRIKSRDLKIKSYEIKLKQVDQIHISNLDSFFVATYPDSMEPRANK